MKRTEAEDSGEVLPLLLSCSARGTSVTLELIGEWWICPTAGAGGAEQRLWRSIGGSPGVLGHPR